VPYASKEPGEENPGWPIKCLAVPRKLLPVYRGDLSRPANPEAKLSAPGDHFPTLPDRKTVMELRFNGVV
jgi:hypothetical protein